MRRFLLILGALAAVAPLRAQETPLEPPDLGGFVRWGPVRVRPSVVLQNLGYDDNVFYRTGDQPTEGDWFVTLSPRVTGVALFGGTAFLTFDGRLDYTAYASTSELNFTNTYLGGRLTIPFETFGFYLDLGHDRTQDRPIDLEDARPIRTNDRLGFGGIVKLGWRVDAEIGVLRSDWRNTDENFLTAEGFTVGDLLDRNEEGTRAKLRYRVRDRLRVTFESQRKTYDFLDDDPRIARDGRESRILPGLEFAQGGRITGSIRYGHARLDLEREGLTDYSGPVGEAKIAWSPGAQTTVRLEALRDATYSIFESNQIYLRKSYDLRVVRYFNRLIGVEAGWRPGKLVFPDQTREDDLNDVDLGVKLRLSENALGRRVEYTLRWTRYRRDSTRDAFDQSRSVVGIGAVVGY